MWAALTEVLVLDETPLTRDVLTPTLFSFLVFLDKGVMVCLRRAIDRTVAADSLAFLSSA